MVDVVILGAGGTAREILGWVAEWQQDEAPYRCIGLLDDDVKLQGTSVGQISVIGRIIDASRYRNARFVDALGSPRSYRQRERIITRAAVAEDRFETVVHARAYVSPNSTIGQGSVIFPNATIGAGAVLGRHVTVLPGAVINHDVRVGDFAIVTSGVNISGNVTVGRAAYLGAGCAIIGGISIGDEALIGMGAVVLDDVAPATTVVGNPARVTVSRTIPND